MLLTNSISDVFGLSFLWKIEFLIFKLELTNEILGRPRKRLELEIFLRNQVMIMCSMQRMVSCYGLEIFTTCQHNCISGSIGFSLKLSGIPHVKFFLWKLETSG